MGELPAVGIHRGHDVDACGVEELADVHVAIVVLVTQVVGQLEYQFSSHGLVAVHVGHILKLGLTCDEKYSLKYIMLIIIIILNVKGHGQKYEHFSTFAIQYATRKCTLIEKGLNKRLLFNVKGLGQKYEHFPHLFYNL